MNEVERDNQLPGTDSGSGRRIGWSAASPEFSRALRLVLEVSNSSVELRVLLESFLAETARLATMNSGVIFLYDEGGELTAPATFGLGSGAKESAIAAARREGRTPALLKLAEPLVVESPGANSGTLPLRDLFVEANSSAALVLPLAVRGSPEGFLVLFDGGRKRVPADAVRTLALLGGLLATALAGRRQSQVQRKRDRARDRFLSALSHELRTPLTSILGFTQIIRRRLQVGSTDSRTGEHIEVIWSQAQRLSRLIETFVDIANIEQGEFAVTLGRVELRDVLLGCIERADNQLGGADRIAAEMPDSPVWAHADSKRLEQVFAHILSNALRYSPASQKVLVRLLAATTDRWVRITVSDKGPGIPENVRGAIYERYHRSDPIRSGGLGVGLFLSRTIVEAHGGDLQIESNPHSGTTVTILLPH